MGEAKPLASLTSGLLARKGQAAPAMRRQSMMLHAVDEATPDHRHNPLDDLGWNDMGEGQEHVRQATGLSPMPASAVPSVEAKAPILPERVVQPIDPAQSVQPGPTPEVVRQQENLARHLSFPEVAPVAPEAPVSAVEPVTAPEPLVPIAPVVQPEAVRVADHAAAEGRPQNRVVQRAAPGSRGKAAFTLRLDAERHLKLRLVCAMNHRSAQHMVTQALDEFLARQPAVNEFVAAGGRTN